MELITKAQQTITRPDGTEIKIVAQAMFGAGLHRSIDVMVFTRKDGEQWHLCNNRPHPEWRTMSVQDYIDHGRSEVLQTVKPIEILKVTSLIGKPMSVLH